MYIDMQVSIITFTDVIKRLFTLQYCTLRHIHVCVCVCVYSIITKVYTTDNNRYCTRYIYVNT